QREPRPSVWHCKERSLGRGFGNPHGGWVFRGGTPWGKHPWGMCGRRRLGKNFLTCCSIGRVRSCVRPVCAALRRRGVVLCAGRVPIRSSHSRCADPSGFSRSPDRPCLHYVVMSSPIPSKLQTPSSLPSLTSFNRSGFDANQSIALRCRRVGAVHSISKYSSRNVRHKEPIRHTLVEAQRRSYRLSSITRAPCRKFVASAAPKRCPG